MGTYQSYQLIWNQYGLLPEDVLYQLQNVRAGEEAAAILVLIPLIEGYLSWLFQEAKKAGIRRVYFLARDGWLFCRYGGELAKRDGWPIECRYLYASRYAWRIPAYCLMGEDCVEFLCARASEVSFQTIMERTGLPAKSWGKWKERLHYRKPMQALLNRKELCRMKEELRKNGAFLSEVFEVSQAAYLNTAGYLEQEGLLEQPFAIADSGWTGSMQQSLSLLLHEMGYRKEIHGYYFGLYARPWGTDPKTYHAYYFTPEHGFGKKLMFNNNLFECIFSSPEGMATGYHREEKTGKYEPVFHTVDNPNKDKLNQLTAWLDCTVDWRFGRFYRLEQNGGKIERRFLQKLFWEWMVLPSKEEYEWFGSMYFNDDLIPDRLHTLTDRGANSAWAEGTAAGEGRRWILTLPYLKKAIRYLRMELRERRKDRRERTCRIG